jgi:hypothetical protein
MGLSKEDLENLHAENPDALVADGLEEAYIGYASRMNMPPLAVYDMKKCREIFLSQGMTEDEADEGLSYNVIGASLGDGTPLFLTPRSDD